VADTQTARGVRPLRAALVTIVVIFVFATGGLLIFQQRAQERVTGVVRAQRTPVGSFAFAVDDCASGHAFVPGFFGVDLRGQSPDQGQGRDQDQGQRQGQRQGRGKTGFDLRVVGSGDDAQLWLYPPGAKSGAIPIGKADCARWDVLVDWAHVTVNRVQTVSGHLRATCAIGGGNLTADVDFVRCAF
jgi:hypothetical protein